MDKHIEELLPFYAMNALSEQERELVESYLAEHPEARSQIEELNDAVSALPLGISPIEPSGHVKEALMARVTAEAKAKTPSLSREQSSRRENRVQSFFQVLSLGAAVAAILWAIVLNLQIARLQEEVATLNQQVANQSQSLQQLIDSLPSSSDVITVSLKGTDIQPRAQGELIADPGSQSAVLVITGLPALEAGRTYQVWLINGGTPVSAGLLTIDEHGRGMVIVTSEESIGSFNALGISIEPEGGSQQPTGDIVVLSEL